MTRKKTWSKYFFIPVVALLWVAMLFSSEGLKLAPEHWVTPVANTVENFVIILSVSLSVCVVLFIFLMFIMWYIENTLEDKMMFLDRREKNILIKTSVAFKDVSLWPLFFTVPTFIMMVAIGWSWTGIFGLLLNACGQYLRSRSIKVLKKYSPMTNDS